MIPVTAGKNTAKTVQKPSTLSGSPAAATGSAVATPYVSAPSDSRADVLRALTHAPDGSSFGLLCAPNRARPCAVVIYPLGVGLEAGECGQDQRGTTFIGRTVVVAEAGKVPLTGLKDALRNADPDFSERRLGYRNFGSFVRAAEARGLIRITGKDDARVVQPPPKRRRRR